MLLFFHFLRYEQNNESEIALTEILNNNSSFNSNSLVVIKTESGNGSPSSTSSEISVGSAVFGSLTNNVQITVNFYIIDGMD